MSPNQEGENTELGHHRGNNTEEVVHNVRGPGRGRLGRGGRGFHRGRGNGEPPVPNRGGPHHVGGARGPNRVHNFCGLGERGGRRALRA